MKVYIRKVDGKALHAEDVRKIREYLEELGTLYIKDSTLEAFYYRFSEERYAASWLNVDDDTLEEFEEWLNEVYL